METKIPRFTSTITYMALMAGLNVIFSLMALFVPLSAIFLVIALPLTSTLVALHTKTKYYPIYAIATLGLTLIISMASIDNVIFYILPSLISGFVFGLLIKHRFFGLDVVIVSSFVQLGLLYFSLWLIKVLFQFDFIDFLFTLFNININPQVVIITPSLLYSLSLIQATLTFLIIGFEIKKFDFAIVIKVAYPRLFGWLNVSLASLIVPLGLFLPQLAFILLGPLIMYAGYHMYCLYRLNSHHLLFLSFGWLLVAIFLFAVFFPLLGQPSAMLLVSIFPLGISLIFAISFYLPSADNNHKIKAQD